MPEDKQYNLIDEECVLADDDDFGGPVKTIVANAAPDGNIQIKHPNQTNTYPEFDTENVNAIDTECNYYDDTDDDWNIDTPVVAKTQNNVKNEISIDQPTEAKITGIILDFNDDDTSSKYVETPAVSVEEDEEDAFFENQELVDEDMLEEKKHVTPGEVEDDYWEKLQKKHKNSNVKGAYNTHFHFAGDPAKEAEMFNHDMGADQGEVIIGGDAGNSVTTAGAGTASSGAGGGMGESYHPILEDLLLITGFDLNKNDDGSYSLVDLYNDNKCTVCKNEDDIYNALSPYIDDYFITPLQVNTGKDYKTCKEWADWYTAGNQKEYPQCKNDIKYCDFWANHLKDCKLF